MLTESTLRLPADPSRINVKDDLEIQWWSAHFQVSPQVLRAAVDEHGPSAADVRAKLHDAARKSFEKGGED
jgi:hypothetical protein